MPQSASVGPGHDALASAPPMEWTNWNRYCKLQYATIFCRKCESAAKPASGRKEGAMVLGLIAFTLLAVNLDLAISDVILLAVVWRTISRR